MLVYWSPDPDGTARKYRGYLSDLCQTPGPSTAVRLGNLTGRVLEEALLVGPALVSFEHCV